MFALSKIRVIQLSLIIVYGGMAGPRGGGPKGLFRMNAFLSFFFSFLSVEQKCGIGIIEGYEKFQMIF